MAEFTYAYPKCDLAATALLWAFPEVGPLEPQILLGRRRADSDAFPNWLCLPGGMAHAGVETAEEAVRREIREEVGIDILSFLQFTTRSGPRTDPRGHVVNVCFQARLGADMVAQIKAGDDITEVMWVWLNEIIDGPAALAFDHREIVQVWANRLGFWR